ncbi:MAG: glycogen synthase GlgA [Prevotella sp.]|nr:glycogen synthase GlgA [Alistipes senegalensis]MCM1358301.1 glycogen synthase GlgA [Prevotella sp.]MCM1472908.1 glycogen synthase GlgA [Muribaculaceae bacterium]
MNNILFAASECVPFIKTGGLADVAGALPKYINKNDFDVRVILPYYTCIPAKYRDNFKYVTHFYMDYGMRKDNVHVGIMEYEYNGIKFYFVDNEYYFKCDTPYSADLKWDIERFTFFCKAVLAILPVIGFRPDIIHCHDWQASLIPVFMHSTFATNPFYSSTKTIMTIHNLKFQGVWNIDTFKYNTALPQYMFTPDKLEFKKDANMLKGGLVYADYITTVSETYAEEIKYPFYGEQLDGLLRARSASLRGIVNGIDYNVFDPNNDKNIYKEYHSKNFRKRKAVNKTELQKELGLPVDESKYMIAIISRLTDQKGLDLVSYTMERICDENTQFVVIGTGDHRYEDMFRHYQWKYPDRVSANILYSDPLAHKLYAAADAMLMPSLFEPCGLTQLISLRYGTVPIVRETGGLKDTVQPYNEFDGTGTGFSFANYNAEEMLGVINYSKHIYFNHRDQWDKMVYRGMTTDYSWNSSARQYEGMYNWIINW